MTKKEALESLKFEVYEEGHCGYIEQELEIAIKVLEKAEKYKWHDLRKNPDDLPEIGERVVITLDFVGEHRNIYGNRAKNGSWVTNGYKISPDVIAWRIDEPFTEE